jgi:ectoine hydroxylase-related dioxygenase (phytanoyl-CoA dioxygenase family)
MRNLLSRYPCVAAWAKSMAGGETVERILGREAFCVRALLFDKTPEANWKVAWHQDLSIAVRHRVDVPGFGPWSVKAGVPHVQPPVDVLERMLTIRLHLDDCDEANGPLKVLPGSHAAGVLSPHALDGWRRRIAPVACVVPAGGAMLMRPLLVHASSSANSPSHRRVIHLEFAAVELPGGLQWHESSVAPAATGESDGE